MCWDGYITSLLSPEDQSPVAEAAIWGTTAGQESVWASSPGLANITVEEIKKLTGDRSDFPVTGCYLGGRKCNVIRDELDKEEFYSLYLKTSSDGPEGGSVNVCVGRTKTAVVIAVGKKDVGGGILNNTVNSVVQYICNNGL